MTIAKGQLRQRNMSGRGKTRSSGNVHAKIERAIGERILSGEFTPGALLPNEAEWGRTYDASRTAVMVMYESAFKNMEIGYGSAIAVILFIVILLVTAGQFSLSKRWVFYQ